ncbi:3-oxoacyl-[acyl-carrier protein] reductase [Bacillus ectoiniformans]|uniref:SDR family oxidoreductase n=1 Tax=Bacillus ectoiniformans TaxID=1494429 RepID=UPI0019572639|nr:SDR family oxidoreductase [Bacillus ectoiniformans]MBM7647886.1 3-oxoacyl-[acyl-carrier protein] reductase [Bacillus ectoiniformans]
MTKKTALITGASRGIGRRTAMAMAESGYNVVINYRSSEKEAIQLAAELSSTYSIHAAAVQGDISNRQDCEQLIKKTAEDFGGVDILIHNAGPYVKERKRLDEYGWDEWEYMMNGNLNSVFYLTKLTLPYMRSRKWGRIITLGFDRVETAPGWVYRSAFAAAKSGIASLTKTISQEEAVHGITANMVCPGDIIGEWKEKSIAEACLEKDEHVPVGRPGAGEDLSRVIAFLTSESSSFITGSVIPVTGGQDVLGKVFRVKPDN